MKKISCRTLLITLLLPSVLVFAREELPPQPLPVSPVPEEPVATSLPFEFSLREGKWADARTGEIFTTGTHAVDFLLPSLKEAPTPIRYPRWAVQEGWEGTFMIATEVLKTGEVGRWKVMESTGYPLLDEAAVRAVHRWKFHPARERGESIVSCIQIPIHFKLED